VVRGSRSQSEELRRHFQQLFRRFGVLSSELTPCGKPLSLAHAHALLTLLSRQELSQQELGAELCIDKSNVARLCARMVEAGHATQRASEHDARSRRISLTARGEKLAREVDVSSRSRFAALLEALPDASRRPVLQALAELTRALDALGPTLPARTPE
jgi:DNA-binding MarR family transcriptional regulator